jgi:hypothetical protein
MHMKIRHKLIAAAMLIAVLMPQMGIAAEPAQEQESKILDSLNVVVERLISYINSSQFLALVIQVQQSQAVTGADKAPAAPTQPATPAQPTKLQKWCSDNGGTYIEIPGQSAAREMLCRD